MIVDFLIVADHASVTKDDKLNILGIFAAINTNTLPAIHPMMAVVFQIIADESEAGTSHKMDIQISDPDGELLHAMNGNVEIPKQPGQILLNGAVNIAGLLLKKHGKYQVALLIDGVVSRKYVFTVKPVQKADA